MGLLCVRVRTSRRKVETRATPFENKSGSFRRSCLQYNPQVLSLGKAASARLPYCGANC